MGEKDRTSRTYKVVGHPLERKERSMRGFTLIELLMVMVIIGLLAAAVVPQFTGKVGKAKLQSAQVQIEMFGAALDAYHLDVSRYPTTEQGLTALRVQPDEASNWDGPYLKKRIPSDPWGNEYIYKSPGDHGEYDIISYGRDGKEGGEDDDRDIVSWRGLADEDEEEE